MSGQNGDIANLLYEKAFVCYENDEAAIAGETEMVATLEEEVLFEDFDFVANGSSLYVDAARPPKGALPPDAMEWNRINQGEVVGCESPITFAEGPESGNVVQGALGNGWFVSALSILASRPELLKSVMVSDINASRGIYTVKFSKHGTWCYVHVDDRVPCNRSGKAHYSRGANPNETWVMVIEKAYAKLHGCYQNLVGGRVDEGLKDLTGGAPIALRWADDTTQLLLQQDGLWEMLKKYKDDGEGCVMGCSSSSSSGGGAGGAGGVLRGRAYSVVAMMEVPAEEADGVDGRFFHCRDPWRLRAEPWSGDWCSGHPLWEEHPAIRERLNPGEFTDDGSFWLSYADFVAQFDQVFMCVDIPSSWESRRFKGEWVPGDKLSGNGGTPKYPLFLTNPMFPFTVTEPTSFMSVVSQADRRWQTDIVNLAGPSSSSSGGEGAGSNGSSSSSSYDRAVGFLVVRLQGGGGKPRLTKLTADKMVGGSRNYAPRRSVSGMYSLGPGRYAVVPSLFQPGTCVERFVLENFFDKPVEFEMEGDRMPEADQLEESEDDDDAVAAGTEAAASSLHCEGAGVAEEEEDGADLKALQLQVGDLASMLRQLQTDVTSLEAKVAEKEEE